MRIEYIKKSLSEMLNKELEFKLNGPRNQNEEFRGKIVKLYNSIFTILDENNVVRSFTYSDVLIKNLIVDKN